MSARALVERTQTAQHRQRVAWRHVQHATGRLARAIAWRRYHAAAHRTARLEAQLEDQRRVDLYTEALAAMSDL